MFIKEEQVALLKNITPDKLWTYDKEHKSPFVPKDEILYGLYMATVKKSSSNIKEYKNLDEAELDFEKGKLPVNVECIIGKKQTTYGRAKLSKICNIDVEQFLKYNEQSDTVKYSKETTNAIKKIAKTSKELFEDIEPVFTKPGRIKGEDTDNYQKRLDKATKQYEKDLETFSKFQKYKKQKKYIEMNAIGMKNIPKFILIMGSHPNKVQEYLEMQKFAARIATMFQLGQVPYDEIFKGMSQKDIDDIIKKPFIDKDGNEILDPKLRDAEAMERKAKLRKEFEKIIEKNIIELPDSNIRELQQSMSKISIAKLLTVYCPTITGETLETLEATVGDSLRNGLSMRSYQAMAEQNRTTLYYKQDLVPVSGYATRQYTDAAIDIRYYEEKKSSDTHGVLLKEEDAGGRTLASKEKIKIGNDTYVRVKSCATNTDKRQKYMVCGDEISHEIMLWTKKKGSKSDDKINEIEEYNNYNDEKDVEYSLEKYTPRNHSCIGISFATGITEGLTQAKQPRLVC